MTEIVLTYVCCAVKTCQPTQHWPVSKSIHFKTLTSLVNPFPLCLLHTTLPLQLLIWCLQVLPTLGFTWTKACHMPLSCGLFHLALMPSKLVCVAELHSAAVARRSAGWQTPRFVIQLLSWFSFGLFLLLEMRNNACYEHINVYWKILAYDEL